MSKLQLSCSFFSEMKFWRNSGRLPDVFNLVCNLDLIHSFLRSSDNLVRADTFVKISSQNCLLLPQTIFSILMWLLSLAYCMRHDLKVSCVSTLYSQASTSLKDLLNFLTRPSSVQFRTWAHVSIALLQLGYFLLCRGLCFAIFC